MSVLGSRRFWFSLLPEAIFDFSSSSIPSRNARTSGRLIAEQKLPARGKSKLRVPARAAAAKSAPEADELLRAAREQAQEITDTAEVSQHSWL